MRSRGFEVTDVMKGDIDLVADVNVRHSLDYLRELARKLYVRNPNQLRRGGYLSRDTALHQLFGPRRLPRPPARIRQEAGIFFVASFIDEHLEHHARALGLNRGDRS